MHDADRTDLIATHAMASRNLLSAEVTDVEYGTLVIEIVMCGGCGHIGCVCTRSEKQNCKKGERGAQTWDGKAHSSVLLVNQKSAGVDG